MERVWGGRLLESFYGRELPENSGPIGEAWEMVDRPEAQSVVNDGPLAGKTLHDLWTQQREAIFGTGFNSDRFPILIKILDARQDLSIQVHPPAQLASQLGGEAKSEMWFIADCDPDAKLYVGLKDGVTRESFKKAIGNGTVADCIHAIKPNPGNSIFIPSGRLHAIGAGFLIHEIQQNSDTTYRVFDWNRVGLDGKPRELHIDESLASIDFADTEPKMDKPTDEVIAESHHFITERHFVASGDPIPQSDPDTFSIVTLISGSIQSASGKSYNRGDTILVPRNAPPLTATHSADILLTLP